MNDRDAVVSPQKRMVVDGGLLVLLRTFDEDIDILQVLDLPLFMMLCNDGNSANGSGRVRLVHIKPPTAEQREVVSAGVRDRSSLSSLLMEIGSSMDTCSI